MKLRNFPLSSMTSKRVTIIEVKNEDVTQVKTKGNGLSTGAKILIEGWDCRRCSSFSACYKAFGKMPFSKCNADQSNAFCDNSR